MEEIGKCPAEMCLRQKECGMYGPVVENNGSCLAGDKEIGWIWYYNKYSSCDAGSWTARRKK